MISGSSFAHETDTNELYRVAGDLSEKHNIAAQNPGSRGTLISGSTPLVERLVVLCQQE